MNIPGFGKMFKSADEQLDPVPTPEAFTRVVGLLSARYDLTVFEAILAICEHNDREPDSVKMLLTPKLRLALLDEASNKNLLKVKDFLSHRLG